MRYRVILLILLSALVFSTLPRSAQAQEDEDMCIDFIRQALSDLGTNCANMESNTACYGSKNVEATFLDDVADDFFSEPGNRADITSLVTLSTAPMDIEESIWGIGVIYVQANIHNAIPQQAVIIAVGDVTVENAVEPETALLPVEAISINTIADVNLYKAPDETSELLGTAASGTALEVDGVSADSLWLRALYNDGEKNYNSWVSAASLDASVDTTSLPVITDESRTPMQELFLRNGFEHPECASALPSLLFVQGPKDTSFDIVINDTPIRISSTVTIQVLPNNQLRVTTLYGMATLNPGTPNQVLVPPGFTTTGCLSDPGEYGGLDKQPNDQTASCPWSSVQMVTRQALSDLHFVQVFPDNTIDYEVVPPTIIGASGIGEPYAVLLFDDDDALAAVEQPCVAGELSPEICRRLFY